MPEYQGICGLVRVHRGDNSLLAEATIAEQAPAVDQMRCGSWRGKRGKKGPCKIGIKIES